jgi:hypothetical protein
MLVNVVGFESGKLSAHNTGLLSKIIERTDSVSVIVATVKLGTLLIDCGDVADQSVSIEIQKRTEHK